MKSSEYKLVKKEVQKYIQMGRPIAAGHVMEQHEARLTHKQYYELTGMIFNALKGA